MKNGMTVYETVVKDRLQEADEDLAQWVKGQLAEAGSSINIRLHRALSHAYMEGMRDGFVQGVAAESASRRKPEA